MLNKVFLQGRMTKDPELRTTQTGLSVTRFSVAVDRNIKDKQTGKYEADFIDCTAWRKTAEFINQYFKKGDPIVVEGSLQNNNYTDSQGVKHYGYVVSISNVYFGMGNRTQERPQSTPQQPQETAQSAVQDMQAKAKDSGIDMGQLGEYNDIISDGDVPF